MNKLKLATLGLTGGLSLIISATALAAIPGTTTPAPAAQVSYIGSDTLDKVSDKLVAALRTAGSVTQITTYVGLGSSQGQRQLEGNPNSGEPTCTATGGGSGDSNPGCEEIAPMSRLMNSTVCDDEVSSGSNTTAEHLAICVDGIAVITDNAAHAQFAEPGTCPAAGATSPNPSWPSASYTGSGKLRSSGVLTVGSGTYTIGGSLGLAGWKDVLRLVYTGCTNDGFGKLKSDGTPDLTCATVNRTDRCSGTANPVRQAIIDRWDYLVNSGAVAGDTAIDCNGATANACASGLRAAYRRDDSSGTTGVFLSLLGLGSNLTARTALVQTSPPPAKVVAISETHMFCDGGDNEDWLPGSTAQAGQVGDPIRKDCKPEDDLCNCDGKMPVVRAVRSPITVGSPPVVSDQNFPPYQCTRGKFLPVTWFATGLNVCPDGTKPLVDKCYLPYFNDTSTNPPTPRFNCMNDSGSHTLRALQCDGRAYNFVMRDNAGVVNFRQGNLPQGGLMRHNTRVLKTTLPVNGGPWTASTPAVCEQEDATLQVGCLVSNTTCTMGWAGREAAAQAPFTNTNEPFQLNGFAPADDNLVSFAYPFARNLYLSAINGFENITSDCESRNGGVSSAFCSDEVAIASAFYNMTAEAQSACSTSGFIPKPVSECIGAQAAGSAGCGAPAVQDHSACLPQ